MVIFGAGIVAKKAIEVIGAGNIDYVVDNNEEKEGIKICGLDVFFFKNKVDEIADNEIVISVSDKYIDEIKQQLDGIGIKNYRTYKEVFYELTKTKIENRVDWLAIYSRAVGWIKDNSVESSAIINSTKLRKPYPEVTGYFIPTLIRWGYKELASNYTKYLISIQRDDGSWFDTDGKAPYIFDSAQILKGLVAAKKNFWNDTDIDESIIAGCEWILSCMTDEGRLVTPSTDCWGDDEDICAEIIHIYCLSPIIEASEIYDIPEYKEKAYKIWNYYKFNWYDKIMNFSLLSHFYAYLMEALLDLGETEMASEAMAKMEAYQKESGAVPGLNNCNWVCSTGLFQLALVWYRLGNYQCANKAFEYACKLQNESGGWYGSYISEEDANENNFYFPDAEISWANKYFLDALYYKNLEQFERVSDSFCEEIATEDDRYKVIKKLVQESVDNASILDVGCGKGRYLKLLKSDEPAKQYNACDISKKVMKSLSDDEFTKVQGSLTNIPFDNNSFDLVYTCEALEHAVDIKNAVKEMARVTKTGGKIAVIDKNKAAYGRLQIEEWEQWFDINELKRLLQMYCSEVQVIEDLGYEGRPADGLFCAWIGIVR